MRKAKILILFMLICCSGVLYGQVGMNTNSPDKSAALDMSTTTNKGLLIPNVSLNSTTDVTSIAGGAPAQSLLVYNTKAAITGTGAAGTGYYYWDTNIWKKLATLGDMTAGDNLGNHKATQDLNMDNNSIINAVNITAAGKTSTQTTAIAKSIDGVSPQAGYIAYSADASGNVQWGPANTVPGAISGIWEFTGTTPVSISNGVTSIIPMNDSTFVLTKNAWVLITYSALPCGNQSGTAVSGALIQGSVDLIINDEKKVSSYFSNIEIFAGGISWNGLGNFVTTQKMIFLPAKTYRIRLQSKVWGGADQYGTNVSVTYNKNMTTIPGAQSDDTQAGLSKISIIAFNQ